MNKFTIVALASLCAASCAHLPPLATSRGLAVEKLLDAVQCEIVGSLHFSPRHAKILRSYAAKIDLELSVEDNTGADGSATLTLPIAPRTVNIISSLGGSAKSVRKVKVAYSVRMSEFKPDDRCGATDVGAPYLENTIGFKEWLVTAVSSLDKRDVVQLGETTYTIEFTLGIGGSGGVSVSTFRIPEARLIGRASRQDIHSLVIALTPIADDPLPPPPIKIQIVGPVDVRPGGAPSALRAAPSRAGATVSVSTEAPQPIAKPRLKLGGKPTTIPLHTLDRLDQLVQRERQKRAIFVD